jgi:hypothetical protein
LISFSFKLVSDQSLIGSGVAGVRRKLPAVGERIKLEPHGVGREFRHDSRVHLIAPLPSLIHRLAEAKVAIPRQMFQKILRWVAELWLSRARVRRRSSRIQKHPIGGVRPNASESSQINTSTIVRAAQGNDSRPFRKKAQKHEYLR